MQRAHFATTEEINFYVRTTLKQWGMSHLPVVFKDQLHIKRAAGLYHPQEKKIEIATRSLRCFSVFRQTFLHELAHALDHQERGTLFTASGRANFHGKNFRKWCRALGVSSSRFIKV